ncbi:MAG: glycerate dehydrogenase [Desulfuromonadales bacterium GWC2_61_20]|nr:MAG: glycerate dehydrogenase [Desulfuromonadales bacterium GWC2_61_20]
MKIVVLDGYTLNPGDLDWQPLEALGDCTIHERTPKELLLERAAGAEVLLTNKVVVGEAEMAALPQLRYIGVLATGYNIVDVAAARRRGITVCNVPAYSTASVAQLTFALLLELTSQVGHHADRVRAGGWASCRDFSFRERPLVELEGLTLGIVGFGAIGRQVAVLGHAFGMAVLVHTAHPERYQATPDGAAVHFVGRDELFAASDVVSLHCPLTEATQGLVDARRLALMRSSAFLLNTSRGALIDEGALAAALNAGKLAGAGLDVLTLEPPAAGNPLLTAANCCITPHIAWATIAARTRLLATTVANVRAFMQGAPQNVVN